MILSTCPTCGHVQPRHSDDCIIVKMNIDVKVLVLAHEFTPFDKFRDTTVCNTKSCYYRKQDHPVPDHEYYYYKAK